MRDNICIIPAKGYSERVPAKNIKPLCGKPLLAYTIERAHDCRLFDDIVVSTESPEVAKVASDYGAEVPYIRPKYLVSNQSGIADVCIDLLKYLQQSGGREYRHTFIFLPTSPFRRLQNIREAYDKFCSIPGARVLMSVKEMEYPPFWALIHNQDDFYHRLFPGHADKRRHELEKTYRPDGMVMILDTKAFIEQGGYNFPEIVIYETPGLGSIDIDNPLDFEFAEFLLETDKMDRYKPYISWLF